MKKAYWKRKFCRKYPISLTKPDNNQPRDRYKRLAVVVHVYYLSIFREILELLLQNTTIGMELYLTGPGCSEKEVRNMIPESLKLVEYLPVENRGRDILPFLKILPKVFADGHDLVLKLHTKGSNHLHRKEHWRNDLFSKLIGEGRVRRAIEIFNQNPFVGMIGPTENILAMQYYYGSNAEIVGELSEKIGIPGSGLSDLNFVAGSMFYAKKEALLPILKMNLSPESFEKEAGQKDGTLAHAIERLFAVGLIEADLQLADTNYNENNPVLMVNKNHYFSS